MLQETLKKFGYPNSLVKEYKNWLVLCRFKQITLGSLILICKDEVNAFSKISSQSFEELPVIIKEIETNLKALFQYEKINYLMLMMVDPEVHFHIIPRYSSDKEFDSKIFTDKGWPTKIPDFQIINEVDDETMAKLIERLRDEFKKSN